MREILFKAKRVDNGEWVEGALVQVDNSENFCYIMPRYNLASSLSPLDLVKMCSKKVLPETLCEYTELTDKHGKRIWENDICRFREWSKGDMCWVGKVHYEHCQFVISGNPNKECESPFLLVMSRFIPENIEVIGNIFDNSELLEER